MLVAPASGGGGGSGHGFYLDFTLDHTKAGAADSSNFPLLIDYTNALLKDVAHGGHVQRSDGFDILPYLDTGRTSLAKFERELYDPTTGHIILHAKMPTISHTSDILLTRLTYGDSGITTDHADLPNTWSNGYARVVHGGDGSTLSGVDSVGGNNFTATNVTASAGQIYGAANFATPASNIWTNNAAAVTAAPITFSAWFKMSSTLSLGEDRVIATVAKTSGLDEFWLSVLNDTGTTYLRLVAQQSGGNIQVRGAITPDTNWHHVIGNFSTITSNIWLDGSALSLSVIGTPQTPASLSDTYIGGLMYNTSNFYGPWKGLLDEVRIASVDRTIDWALTEFNNQNSPSTFYSVGAEGTF